jgi:WD40 repeat protein
MSSILNKFATSNPLVIVTLDVSPDGETLVVGQMGDAQSKLALGLWSLDGFRLVAALISEEGAIPLAARFSPSGRLLAYSDEDQNMVLRDLRSGEVNREAFPLAFTKWISFAWNRDRLIAGGTHTQVWDADLNTVVWTLPVNPLPARRNIVPPLCALSADGERVAASGVEPGRIVIYDISSGQIVGRLEQTMNAARSIAFDPSGRFLAAVAESGEAGLWELQSGAPMLLERIDRRADYYWCVRFHPDGRHVAFGLWSGFVELIGLQDGSFVINQDEPVHLGRVWDLAFTRDGRRMFTGGDDGLIITWGLGEETPMTSA